MKINKKSLLYRLNKHIIKHSIFVNMLYNGAYKPRYNESYPKAVSYWNLRTREPYEMPQTVYDFFSVPLKYLLCYMPLFFSVVFFFGACVYTELCAILQLVLGIDLDVLGVFGSAILITEAVILVLSIATMFNAALDDQKNKLHTMIEFTED